jgi:hypothetical protein
LAEEERAWAAMQGKWKAWEHSAVNTAELPPLLTPREHTPHRACAQHLFNHQMLKDLLILVHRKFTHFISKSD